MQLENTQKIYESKMKRLETQQAINHLKNTLKEEIEFYNFVINQNSKSSIKFK